MAFCLFIAVILAAAADLPGGNRAFTETVLEGNSTSYQAACYAFFILYFMFFSLGTAFIPWLYMAEVAASPSGTTRTASVAITVAVRFSTDTMMDWILVYGLGDLGWKFWAVWLVLDVFWAVMVFLLLPETAGKSLEKIDERFVEGVGWFVTVRDRRIEGGKSAGDVSARIGGGFESVEMDDNIRRKGVSPDAEQMGPPGNPATTEELR